MEIIPIKMAHAIFFRASLLDGDGCARPRTGDLECFNSDRGRILPAAAVVTAVFRGRADLFGRTPFDGARGRPATHRATSTHLTGSISKQRMPEQKNHTPDHPKGAYVTDTPH